MFRIDNTGNSNRPLMPPPPGQTGSGRNTSQLPPGSTAMPPGQISSLTDIAEEMSLHLADKTEKKGHSERKVRPDHQIVPMPAPAVLELMAHAKDPLTQDKLEHLLRQLRSGQHSASSLRQEISRSFNDITQQFLSAHYLLAHTAQGADAPELASTVQQVITELEQEHGALIWAGVNTASTLGPESPGCDDFQNLTDVYREFALSPRTLGETLKLSLQAFGGLGAARSLELMSTALSSDLNAARPSTSPKLLASVSASLYQIRSVITALYACNDLADSWRLKGHVNADGERLMLELATLTEKKHTATRDIAPMPDKHGMDDLPARLSFLSGILAVVTDLPVFIFTDGNARSSCTDAIRACITESAELEDQL